MDIMIFVNKMTDILQWLNISYHITYILRVQHAIQMVQSTWHKSTQGVGILERYSVVEVT